VLYCREYLALNVYLALCYFKINYHDMSQVSVIFFLEYSPLFHVGNDSQPSDLPGETFAEHLVMTFKK